VRDPPHVGVVSIMIRSIKKHRNDVKAPGTQIT
jgi:hypothetical protein